MEDFGFIRKGQNWSELNNQQIILNLTMIRKLYKLIKAGEEITNWSLEDIYNEWGKGKEEANIKNLTITPSPLDELSTKYLEAQIEKEYSVVIMRINNEIKIFNLDDNVSEQHIEITEELSNQGVGNFCVFGLIKNKTLYIEDE